MKLYRCWLTIYDTEKFSPVQWWNNPENAIAIYAASEYMPYRDANQFAKGFNESEIENRLGVWIVVCLQGNEPLPNDELRILSATVPLN